MRDLLINASRHFGYVTGELRKDENGYSVELDDPSRDSTLRRRSA